MPTDRLPPVITLRGTRDYDRFLDRLLKAAQKRRPALKSRTKLVEIALAEMGLRHRLKAPARAKAWGANQHGEPAD